MNRAMKVTVEFEMSTGQILTCCYSYSVTPGNYSGAWGDCYPDESEQSEPEYFIDDELIDEKDLPKGLDLIAAAMYDDGESDSRFTYKEEPDNDY